MRRIHVTGASGAGTSTVGRLLAETLRTPFVDVDDHYWAPTDPPFVGRKSRSPLHTRGLARGLRELRLARLRTREARRFGERIVEGGDMHRRHVEFMAWAAQYEEGRLPGRSRTRHEEWLARLSCPCLRLDGTRAPEALVGEIRSAL